MNENDTFLRLSRVDFEEISIILQNWWIGTTFKRLPGIAEKDNFLRKHGWTYKEWYAERQFRYEKRFKNI